MASPVMSTPSSLPSLSSLSDDVATTTVVDFLEAAWALTLKNVAKNERFILGISKRYTFVLDSLAIRLFRRHIPLSWLWDKNGTCTFVFSAARSRLLISSSHCDFTSITWYFAAWSSFFNWSISFLWQVHTHIYRSVMYNGVKKVTDTNKIVCFGVQCCIVLTLLTCIMIDT